MKAVLFDCDGTLIDSEHAHYLSWKQALVDLGSDLEKDEYRQHAGKSPHITADLIGKKIGHDCPEGLLKRKIDHYQVHSPSLLTPIEPTVNFLKELAAKKEQLGIKIGVCSAGGTESIAFHLRHLGIDHLLDIVLSGRDDLSDYSDPEGVNKPKPYIYLHAAKLLGISPAECVVIEDSAPGATAAVTAGCFTIAIPNDYTRNQDLSHAHLRLDSLSGITPTQFFQKIELLLKA